MASPIVEAHGLAKRFGKVEALAGLDLVAHSGQVVAVLGPNGAGKTTFVRTIATLVRPDAGSLRVDGIDVARHPEQVRRIIGLAGQYAAVEEAMTGRENLDMVARLFGHDRTTARCQRGRRARATGPDRRRRPAGAHVLGWHAAPARPRRQPRRGAPPAAARRAHHGPRPPQPHGPLGCHPRAGRPRHRRAVDDPVPRRGRPARKPGGHHRPRPGDRRGHAERAEVARRARRHRGPRPPGRRPGQAWQAPWHPSVPGRHGSTLPRAA